MKTLKTMSVILLALVPALFVLAEQRLASAHAPNLQTGKIIGSVLDANNARIVGATIKVRQQRFKREVRSDEEGEFTVELPAGVYQITVEQPGFRRFELPSYRVEANVSAVLTVQMKVKEPRGLQKVE